MRTKSGVPYGLPTDPTHTPSQRKRPATPDFKIFSDDTLSKTIEENATAAEQLRNDHHDATEKLTAEHTAIVQNMRAELTELQVAADDAATAATEGAQAQDKLFAELQQSSAAALQAESDAHTSTKEMHAQQVSTLKSEHSAAVKVPSSKLCIPLNVIF